MGYQNQGPYQNYGPMPPSEMQNAQDAADQAVPRVAPQRSQGMMDLLNSLPHPNPAAPHSQGDNRQQDISPMATYQAMADKLSSPYLMFPKPQEGSFFSNHPLLTGALDQGLAAAALTHIAPVASAGENIAAGLRGILEARQMARQNQVQQAMLPYQLMRPQLEAQHLGAQISQETASANLANTRAEYEPALMTGRANLANAGAERQLGWHTGSGSYQDPETQQTYVIQSNAAGKVRTVDNQGNEAPADVHLRAMSRTGGNPNVDFSEPGILRRIHDGDPSAPADLARYNQAQASAAAAHAQGAQNVNQPINNADKYHNNEVKRASEAIPKLQTPGQYYEANSQQHIDDLTHGNEPGYVSNYDKYLTERQQSINDNNDMISRYDASGAGRVGISFNQFKADPDAYTGKAAKQPAPASSAPASGKVPFWNAKTQRYETPK